MSGFEPWMWEREGEAEKAKSGKSDAEILLDGLKHSDIVVAFFKNRAGSYLPEQAFQAAIPEPFHASVFEICHARALGKPVHLYVVGEKYKASLACILSILADPLILPDHAEIVASEEELRDAVLRRLHPKSRVISLNPSEEFDLLCESLNLESQIVGLRSALTFWDGINYAKRIPLISDLNLVPSKTKRLYAEALSSAAGVMANQAAYDRAIQAATLSVRSFLELGSWYEMYSEIQALSGILSMAGRSQAVRVNHFGLIPAMRAYPDLQSSYLDSAGTILMRAGNWRAARKWLRRVSLQDPSPYALSKYAATLVASGKVHDLDEAESTIHIHALPYAELTGASLGYTLRHAASLAVAQNEMGSAKSLLDRAEKECLRTGALHTLRGIRGLQSLTELVAKS
jgi:tetratricopeptide (TPR) repeat protein